jgi:formiminoglutamate deiminase
VSPAAAFLAEHAWLGPELGVADDVLISVEGDRISEVRPNAGPGAGGTGDGERTSLPGLTLPGLVNGHSHAFHRALRGRSEAGRGDFWTWRSLMYGVAARLEPDTYLELATAVYAEMALAGITAVAEFHYLHHGPDGRPYADPNTMAASLIEAAKRAGVRITLLDTCYLRGGLDGRALEGAQVRFADGGGEEWARRVDSLREQVKGSKPAHARIGAAIHSVRAVPPEAMKTVATYAARHELPLHVHLSEQRRENEESLAIEGCSPTELLRRAGALTSHTTCVHATHLLPHDITELGLASATICACPTTERDLADGVGPFADLVDAGCPLSIGTDSHAVIDPFEEMRGIELNERLVRYERGLHDAESLLTAGTAGGARSIGWPETGAIKEGSLADLVTLDLDSPRLAGTSPDAAAAVYAAAAADVRYVVVGGEMVVDDRVHARIEDVGRHLADAISTLVGQ